MKLKITYKKPERFTLKIKHTPNVPAVVLKAADKRLANQLMRGML